MVGLLPTSTATHVTFKLATSTEPLYGLTVVPCGGSVPVWEFGTGGGNAVRPDTIVYGVLPKGYTLRSGPAPLTPGCYRVIVSGPAQMQFRVGADGTVAALGRPAGETAAASPDTTR